MMQPTSSWSPSAAWACAAARHARAGLWPVAIALSGMAWAQSPSDMQRVEITAPASTDDSQEGSAARQIVSRQELARYGDANVADVLRRVPGIVVLGSGGRASDIRMRGLGAGYTQVLVNGEPMPAGASLESLSPAQIERIEILRVPTVDLASQAIAGTINIILRQSARKSQREIKASIGAPDERATHALEAQFSDRLDGFSYALGAGLSRRKNLWPSFIVQRAADAAGSPTLERTTDRHATGRADAASLTPRFTWSLTETDRLTFDALVRHTRFDDESADLRTAVLGPWPPYLSSTQTLDLSTSLAQPRVQWLHKLDGGATLDTRLGLNRLRRHAQTVFLGRDENGALALEERVGSNTRENGLTLAGKFLLPYTDRHAVALGWDGEHTRRDESRSQRQSSPIGRPVVDLDESYRSTVERLGLYAQDEWEVDDRLNLYLGVRWNMLRTRTEGPASAAVGKRSSVLSPVLEAAWKVPGTDGDQARFALSRTYKAPRAVDLVPRRFVAFDNTPTTPNFQGNPELLPELAWGIDLAYEHALDNKAGSLQLSASVRRIRDVILDSLDFTNGAWTSTKVNRGTARVLALEIDLRWRLRSTWPLAPDVDLRGGLSQNRSRVDSLPGPDNRLDRQVPGSATLGLDWRLDGQPVTLGASLAWRGSMRARTTLTQTTSSSADRTLDAYALWKPSAAWQLRASVTNALRPHDTSTDSYVDAQGTFHQTTEATHRAELRLNAEYRF